jgi:hypothetical protein
MSTPNVQSTQNATTTNSTSTTALNANTARIAFSIQNQSTNKLYVYLGTGATTSVYTWVLAACTATADGTGGSVSMESGVVYNGPITVAGTSPSYSVLEIAP